jgi:tetratricopeptide (TPR) repeat protein
MPRTCFSRLLLPLVLLVATGTHVFAALPVNSYELRRNEAFRLTDEHSPKAEKALKSLLAEKTDDGSVLFALGRVALHNSDPLKPGAKRKEMRRQGRDYMSRAQAAGYNDPLIATTLALINPDGSDNSITFSDHARVDQLMQEGERLFSQRNFAKAAEKYEKALALEPGNYAAALYVGDANFAAGNLDKAIVWFDKAITLNPDRETGHRYAADAFARSGKAKEALEHYVAAVVAEPRNGYTWRALGTYCQSALIKPWTAPYNVPFAQITTKGSDRSLELSETFSQFDVAYGMARLQWQQENRERHFPTGTPYRLTLEEESYALRATIEVYRSARDEADQSADAAEQLKNLRLNYDQLAEIEAAGMLEAHILLIRADADLSQDYPAYRKEHRQLVHDYLVRYFLHLAS